MNFSPLKPGHFTTPEWQSFRLRPYAGVFPGFNGQGSKSLTPRGASCGQPVWIGPAAAERALIVEGEPDSLAAAEIAIQENALAGLAIVCIFSSSIAIPCHCLPLFEGRKVRIVPHCGDAKRQGEIGAVKWAAQLKPWASTVQIFSLAGLKIPDGSPVGDLGDLAKCSPLSIAALKGVVAW